MLSGFPVDGGWTMRVLGLDPGTARTGYGVVGLEHGRLVRFASGVVQLGRGPLAPRLATLHRELDRIIQTHKPTACAVEGLFHHRNPRSALLLGHARGVCLLVAAAHGLDVAEYPPATVKKAMTGHGGAEKHQVGFMVARRLGEEPQTAMDASDALAVAICRLEDERSLRVFG
jgi:crossover junction endodeoxyribonuclease RuvC